MRKTRSKKKQQLKELSKNWLIREVGYGKKSQLAINKEWTKILSLIDANKLKNNIQFMWNRFETSIEFKDFTISLLLDELKEVEKFHMMSFKSYNEHVYDLIQILHQNINNLMQDNREKLNKLIKTTLDILKSNQNSTNNWKTFLKTNINTLLERRKHELYNEKTKNFAHYEEEIYMRQRTTKKLFADFEMKCKSMRSNIEYVQNRYETKLKGLNKFICPVNKQDEAMQLSIKIERQKMINLGEMINKLQKKYKYMEKDVNHELKKMKSEAVIFHEVYSDLRKKLRNETENDANKLKTVTIEFIKTYDSYQHLVKRGQHLIGLLQICRKFENFNDVLFPYPDDEVETSWKCLDDPLLLFWQRLAKVKAEKMEMVEEKQSLLKTNRELTEKIAFLKEKSNEIMDQFAQDQKKSIIVTDERSIFS